MLVGNFFIVGSSSEEVSGRRQGSNLQSTELPSHYTSLRTTPIILFANVLFVNCNGRLHQLRFNLVHTAVA